MIYGPAILPRFDGFRSKVIRPPIDSPGTHLMISGTAYFCYLGYTNEPVMLAYVAARMTSVGGGAQTAEMGFFRTDSGPDLTAKTYYPIAATGTLDTLTATNGQKKNTVSLAALCPRGIHVWAGMRTAMATTQPTMRNATNDPGLGLFQVTAGASALTGAGPWVGTLPAATDTGPFLWGVLA